MDLINRQDAIDVCCSDCFGKGCQRYPCQPIIEKLLALPSAQHESASLRKQGEWDMFELITSAWYGKQYYFREHDNIVYSRKSGKNMTVNEAISEFIREISDDGSY